MSSSVDIVTASAGTGKTYRLTSIIEDAVLDGRQPEKILATTFTVKAAEELRERIRARLVEKGLVAEAIRMLGARIGTVNSVCGGLIGEYAIGLGLSPVSDVISDEAQVRIFRVAADEAIARHAPQLEPLARCLGHFEGQKHYDWRKDVNDIVASARANGMAPDQFDSFAWRSAEGYKRLVSKPNRGETTAALDQRLSDAISDLLKRYPDNEGLTSGTTKALDKVREIARGQKAGDLPWSDWARLAKLGGTKADDEYFEPLREAASALVRHPRLITQVETYTASIFSCAAEAMNAYDAYKRKWGLIDFVDQERLALSLLKSKSLSASLSERIASVYVDEFQDTSPLQLALFVALSEIAEASAWVGDPKQAIYGFRGADPELISRVAPKIQSATGGRAASLDKSYRSREALVTFVNDAFGSTFESMRLPKEAIRIEHVERKDLPGQQTALNVWHVQGKTIDARAVALANGIMERLADSGAWQVEDHGGSRGLLPGDIAILCATNERCLAFAGALSSFGLKVAIERDGLFGAPEVKLAMAALRWCADNRDTLAIAEIANLLHTSAGQPEWFAASLSEGAQDALIRLTPMTEDLRIICETSAHKSPLELLDTVLISGGVSDAVRRWGESADRVANLEALRALAATYHEECKRDRTPATATGLCAWLVEQEGKQPASRAADAITILTYHRAKGLEWPMVILTDLERKPKGDAFGLHVMSDRAAADIDWRDPLADRWLRLWPWPFGALETGVGLDTTAQSSPEGVEAARLEREERVRVLYVGATRARDYLVLTIPPSKAGWPWLEELRSADGNAAIALPAVGASETTVNGIRHAVRVATLAPIDPPDFEAVSSDYASPLQSTRQFEPLALRPSDSGIEQNVRIVEEISLGGRVPFVGSPDMAMVGEALHGFLAADDPKFAAEKRVALAERLLRAWGVTGLDPRDVVTMGDRFWSFIAKQWPDGVLRRETPVVHRIGNRTLNGRIDAVVETPDTIVVLDHKSFPGARPQWQSQAEKHFGQLRLYAEALATESSSAKPIQTVLHLPISGNVLFLEGDAD